LLIYGAISGLKRTGISFCISELKQRFVDFWQSAAERYWHGHQRVEKATESMRACRWTTCFFVSISDAFYKTSHRIRVLWSAISSHSHSWMLVLMRSLCIGRAMWQLSPSAT